MKFKLFVLLLIASTMNAEADYTSVLNAISNSDYNQVANEIKEVQLSDLQKKALIEFSNDIVQTKRTHFIFDWVKAFCSNKLLASGFISLIIHTLCEKLENNVRLQRDNPAMYERMSDITDPQLMLVITWLVYFSSFAVFCSAIGDGNTYYKELRDKLTHAEAIKALLLSNG